MKTTKNRVVPLFLCAVLFFVLVFAVALYSYAAETLTLEQAVDTALRNNPGLKAADAQGDRVGNLQQDE